jgi:N12 class adenine-specific DNA methylase
MLNEVLAKFPELMLGSYPVLDTPEYKVKVTLESKDAAYLDRALQSFLASLPKDSVQRIE